MGFKWGCTLETPEQKFVTHDTFRNEDLKYLEVFGHHKRPLEQAHTVKGKVCLLKENIPNGFMWGKTKKVLLGIFFFFFPQDCEFSLHALKLRAL